MRSISARQIYSPVRPDLMAKYIWDGCGDELGSLITDRLIQ